MDELENPSGIISNNDFVRISNEDDCSTHKSVYTSLYKASRLPINQEQRREQLLSKIKERRCQAVNEMRGLTDLFCVDNQDADEEPEPMEVEIKSNCHGRKLNIFRNQLMLSEWFKEIPIDLESNWLVKLCPIGVRNLVIARNRTTKAYNRRGVQQCEFQSQLPGGNSITKSSQIFTVLDCVFNYQRKCYFILDVVAWRNCSVQFSDTEFRCFWLKSKLDETPELKEKTTLNKYPFYGIESFAAELPLIQDKLSRSHELNDHIIPLDGILFYHRKMPYIKSYTPLVGWLKPYMVPEMLHIPVADYYMKKMPHTYTSLGDYIDKKPTSYEQKKDDAKGKMDTFSSDQ